METYSIRGNLVDPVNETIYAASLEIHEGRIQKITPVEPSQGDAFILPGFIDAHVHIESSMMVPSEFARIATLHGTVATVSDPHEIANVLGLQGVRYMIENGKKVPFHFYFGAPSCVPATSFETAGANLDVNAIQALFAEDNLLYLSEMMNYPGVLNKDPLVMEKIETAKKWGRPIDGHAPGLKGDAAARYAAAGITTDHECFTLEEALDKIQAGMKILIREGSAAKNYEALHTLLKSHPEKVMFSSDDKHPNDLVKGHINELVRRSIVEKKYDLMKVLRAASYNPVQHYGLQTGLLQEGDSADFIVVDSLENFRVLKTFVKGMLAAENGRPLIPSVPSETVNQFHISEIKMSDFACPKMKGRLQVIRALDGELITDKCLMEPKCVNGFCVSDPTRDLLKIVVVNRYKSAKPAIAFVTGFGLKSGAIASCIAHDCHNIIAVGVTDEDICSAVNSVINCKGGISAASGKEVVFLPLAVAGIMSANDGFLIAKDYERLDKMAKSLGSGLHAPFMTLSFMALLVIPSLKLSDRGLFDAETFEFTPLQKD